MKNHQPNPTPLIDGLLFSASASLLAAQAKVSTHRMPRRNAWQSGIRGDYASWRHNPDPDTQEGQWVGRRRPGAEGIKSFNWSPAGKRLRQRQPHLPLKSRRVRA